MALFLLSKVSATKVTHTRTWRGAIKAKKLLVPNESSMLKIYKGSNLISATPNIMLLANIFYTKVIYYQTKFYWYPFMAP